MSYENASLPLPSTKPDLNTKPSIHSLNSGCNLMTNNDSKISFDSESDTLVRNHAHHQPLTLRVVNPDVYRDITELLPVNNHYKPALRSIVSSPEIQHVSIYQQQEQPSPQQQLQQAEEYKPTVIRKVSKTLVEKQRKMELPLLEILPPLLTINESHLLCNTTASSPLLHLDLSPTSPTQKSPASVAQQSINAMVITTAEELTITPDEIEQNDLTRASINQHHQPANNRRQSRDLLQEQSPPISQNASPPSIKHVRIPSVTPSLTPSSIHTTHMHQQQASYSFSRYSKASYSLTNQPNAIELYRRMATKTKDLQVQLAYAKYLLDVASLYDEHHGSSGPNAGSHRDSSVTTGPGIFQPASINSRRSSIDTHVTHRTTGRNSVLTQNKLFDENEAVNRKKRRMLEKEGVSWIKKLAKKQVGEAAYLWALCLDRGMYNIRKNDTDALKYYEIAADQKVPEAMFAMGQYREKKQEYFDSFQLYNAAANLGLAEAIYTIAIMHLNGQSGFKRDTKTAVKLLEKASEKSTRTCPEATYTLGLLLTNDYPSINLPSELIQEFGGTSAGTKYFANAAEMGMSAAQYRIGYIYEKGLFHNQVNIAEAYKYYELSANNNNNKSFYAMLGLSRIHNQGIKVPKEQLNEQSTNFERDESKWCQTHPRDEVAAFEWCQSAASHKLVDACYLLGWYYEIGIGVPRDFAQAHHYYSKAVKKGNHMEARDRINLLETLLKQQKSEKRRTDKKLSVLTSNTNTAVKSNSNRDTQCQLM